MVAPPAAERRRCSQEYRSGRPPSTFWRQGPETSSGRSPRRFLSGSRHFGEVAEAPRGAPRSFGEVAEAARGAPRKGAEVAEGARSAPWSFGEVAEAARGAPRKGG